MRSRTDSKLAGVCGGIAAYFNIDVTLVRILWVISSILGGPGIGIYIICAIVIPKEPIVRSYDQPGESGEDATVKEASYEAMKKESDDIKVQTNEEVSTEEIEKELNGDDKEDTRTEEAYEEDFYSDNIYDEPLNRSSSPTYDDEHLREEYEDDYEAYRKERDVYRKSYDDYNERPKRDFNIAYLGLGLIGLGAYFGFKVIFPSFGFHILMPVIMIIGGLLLLNRNRNDEEKY